MDLDYNSLFGSDPGAAQASAQAIAQALRQRRAAGQLGLATGDSANAAVGKELTGDADKMEQGLVGAAQHRAGLDVQRKHLEQQAAQLQAMMGYRKDQIEAKQNNFDTNAAQKQQQLDQTEEYRKLLLGLKGSERIATHDALGNPIFARKFGGGGGPSRGPPAAPVPMLGSSPAPGPAPIAAPGGAGAAPGAVPGPGATVPPGQFTPGPTGPSPSKGIPDGRGGFLLSPVALDQAAEAFWKDKKLPAVARGRVGSLIASAVANRAAELHPGSSYPGGQSFSPLQGKDLDKELISFGADLDPTGGRAGEFGKNYARTQAATALLALATDEQGRPRNLTPQQMPELSQALAALISRASSGAQAQIEHLTPHSLVGNSAAIIQWLTNEPTGTNQVAFVRNMVETALRERDVASKALADTARSRISKHQGLIKSNPEEARATLKAYGLDPSLIDNYGSNNHGAGAQSPSSGSKTSGPRITRTNPQTGETRIWNGSAWVKE
jgi:hypothetical protein